MMVADGLGPEPSGGVQCHRDTDIFLALMAGEEIMEDGKGLNAAAFGRKS